MKQLKTLLQQTRYRIFFIALFITSTILSVENVFYVVILIPYIVYVSKNHKKILKYILVILIIYFCNRIIRDKIAIHEQSSYNVVVISTVEHESYTTAVVRYGIHKLNLQINKPLALEPGHRINIVGSLNKVDQQTIPGNFDYKGYLQSKGIKYKITAYKYDITGKRFHVFMIRKIIGEYVSKVAPNSSAYIKTFVLADKSEFDQNLRKDISNLGISHLFAISGMHVSLIVITLISIMKKIKLEEEHSTIIIIVFLTIFSILTAFSPSVLRAVLMYILLKINDKFDLKLSSLDIISLIFLILLVLNPYIYKNLGFTLSFLVAVTIILSTNILSNKSKNIQLLVIGIVSLLITMPITTSINYQVNFLAVILNVFFIYFVTFTILPLSFMTLIIPPFDVVFRVVIIIFETLTTSFSTFDVFTMNIGFSNPFYVVLYYISILYILQNIGDRNQLPKCIFIFIIMMILISMSHTFSFAKQVNFIDVHGDATFVSDQFNQCNILIDTGDIDDYNQVINYLQKKNVKRLDYLIITHNHSDHYGEFDDIHKSFKVYNTISNTDIDFLRSNLLTCGSISMKFFESELYPNENNNSIVMILNIANRNYLFTGDIEVDRENTLLNHSFPTINYLKIPHHGSRTSSTRSFLEHTKPLGAIVIASRNNRHKHPNSDVMERYASLDIPVERTDQLGTISHIYIFGKEFKRYHQP